MFIVSTKKEECIRTYLHYYWFPGVREQVSNVFWKPAKWEINNLAAANSLNLKINNITHSHNQFRQEVQTFLFCLQTSIYSIKGRGVRTTKKATIGSPANHDFNPVCWRANDGYVL